MTCAHDYKPVDVDAGLPPDLRRLQCEACGAWTVPGATAEEYGKRLQAGLLAAGGNFVQASPTDPTVDWEAYYKAKAKP